MSEITISAAGPARYHVGIRQGRVSTSHIVTVPRGMLDDLDLAGVGEDAVVRESMAFLLEREPPGAILKEFTLSDINRYFGNYHEELCRRLGK